VNTRLKTIIAAMITKRFGLRRRALVLFVALPPLLLCPAPGVVRAQVQSSTPAKPSTAREQKRDPAETSAAGTIKGRVVSDDGQPLVNATVFAQAVTGTPAVKVKRVDAEGAFVFDELPAALYTITASAPGYVVQSPTTGDPGRGPRHMVGAQLKITMSKGGVITGVVTNSNGEPVVGVPVQASLASAPAASVADILGGVSPAESDDRGVYRIYGLQPGRYTVVAGGGTKFGLFGASGFDLDVPTYHPSSTRDTATPVVVGSGEVIAGIDIKYRGVEGRSISGSVVGTAEADLASGAAVVMLSHAGSAAVLSSALARVVDQRLAAFSLYGVADGEYDVYARFQSGTDDNASVAAKRVIVRGGDVSGVELRLSRLASIAGTIALDPIKDENRCDGRRAQLVETLVEIPRDEPKKAGSQLPTSLLDGSGATLNAKGEFTLRNLEAGRYRFALGLPTDGWYVRAISLPAPARRGAGPSATTPNQNDPSQGVVTVKPGERVGGVSVIVAQDAAGLRGVVTRTPEGATIPAGARVHLVPAGREQADDVLRYSEVPVNGDGSFAFENIAPGRYFIAARVEPSAETKVTPPRPLAWDTTARTKLRREVETANVVVELKPCQRLDGYALNLTAAR
jgi:hypothetical protein